MFHAIALASYKAWPIVPTLIAADAIVPGSFPWGSITATGVLVWYLWYTVCKAGPRLHEAHAAQLAEQRKHYEKILGDQQDKHADSLKDLSDSLTESVTQLGNALKRE